jgi:hypothetical protein
VVSLVPLLVLTQAPPVSTLELLLVTLVPLVPLVDIPVPLVDILVPLVGILELLVVTRVPLAATPVLLPPVTKCTLYYKGFKETQNIQSVVPVI